MANKDLRDWIGAVQAAGELKTITGAEPKEEIGGIVDIYQRKMGNPAVMFDQVPGFPKGHRVIANILTSVARINVALGLPPEASEMELIQWWRNYMKHAPSHVPKAVNGGPLLENVVEGKDINIESIPTPVWHEHDGGPFIGAACLVVMKDPDSGWVNYGTYRVQSHEPKLASVMMSPGKHGLIIMRKYHERGLPCPVAVVAGMPPAPSSASRSRSSTCPKRDCRCRRIPRSPSRASSVPTTRSRRGRSANGPAITPRAARSSPRSASRR